MRKMRSWKVWGVLGLLLALAVVVGYGQGPYTMTVHSHGMTLNAIRTVYNDIDGSRWGVVIGASHRDETDAATAQLPAYRAGGRIWGYNPDAGVPAGWATERGNLFINSWGGDTHLNLFRGNVGIGMGLGHEGNSPDSPPLRSKLAVRGLPVGPPTGDTSGTAGMLCITNDGNIWIDTTLETPCQQ